MVPGGAAGPAARSPGESQHPARNIKRITNIGVSRQNFAKICYGFTVAVSSCQVQGDVGIKKGKGKSERFTTETQRAQRYTGKSKMKGAQKAPPSFLFNSLCLCGEIL
jgi:hypothetical protein